MKRLIAMGALLCCVSIMTTNAQVSNDNEDQVNRVTSPSLENYVPGQVLVKFKDSSPVNVRRAAGKFQSVDKSAVDAVLKDFGTAKMEQLFPNDKPGCALRRAKSYNGQTIQERDLSQLYLVEIETAKAEETMKMVERLAALEEVEFAEPNYKVYIMADDHIADSYSSNPYLGQQWGLDSYGVKELWNKPIVNSRRPIVAILDTGVDITHPDLKDNIWTNLPEANGVDGYDNDNNGFVGDVHGWDFVNNSPKVRDNNMHGTHVAGITAAANNDIGIIGANPQALIMPVTVMQSDGTGDVATIIKGIEYASQNGADVINLSLGSYANSLSERLALERAYQTSVIVAAAGNDGKHIYPYNCGAPCHSPLYPAGYSFVLGVQAEGSPGVLAMYSNFDCDGPNYSEITTFRDPEGFNYELQAPGSNILSTIPGGDYKYLNGTSMATPLVAGAISALMMVKQYDTQEILWGDLIHSSNIAGAYNIKDRPAEFDLLRVKYNDREDGAPASDNDEEEYSADGEVDAGETISIYPLVRTTFGEARNVKMWLTVGDYEDPEAVEIINDENNKVDFGMNLDAYGRGTALNPVKVKIPANTADGRHIKMKIMFICDGIDTPQEGKFTMIAVNRKKISGMIDKDMTLTADHVYYVNENLAVLQGVTLTIEPGTRVEFAEGMGLSSSGKLIANGTPEKPIVFTRHIGEGPWTGLKSHASNGRTDYARFLYTNADSTLFTLARTELTPRRIDYNLYYSLMYNKDKVDNPDKSFRLRDYIQDMLENEWDPLDMTSRMEKTKDPNFLTPAVLAMKQDIMDYYNNLLQSTEYRREWTEDMNTNLESWVWAGIYGDFIEWCTYNNPRDTISYCRIEQFMRGDDWETVYPYMKDCYIAPMDEYVMSQCGKIMYQYNVLNTIAGERNTVTAISSQCNVGENLKNLYHSNIVNNYFGDYSAESLTRYSWLNESNYFNNAQTCNTEGKYKGKDYSLAVNTRQVTVDKSETPSYLGSAREDILRPWFYEIGNAPNTFGKIDLSNLRTTPVSEAHGIVWKVLVNGFDAQDQYEQLPPLGVGKHKFEVYFNRPMNKAVAPLVSFGVRDPYTQNAVDEEGSWNAEGTIYTVYKTITGKTRSDGVNRIYVSGAEDNEFFPCPFENKRFNMLINAAGSMATGFAAEPGMGKVTLTWNNSENNFDDAMGFNIYRYHEYQAQVPDLDEWGGYQWMYDENNNPIFDEYGSHMYKQKWVTLADTIRINQEMIDINTTTYVDYEVTPKETYYYYYKVLSTALEEYDVSNVVSVTPLTSTRGDANGDGSVNVIDVQTTVNYAGGKQPRPFIFEAADMNADQLIDILDVIGIIRGILNPSLLATSQTEAQAIYSIENGVLYVDCPVPLAGIQLQLKTPQTSDDNSLKPAEDLNGFELSTSWLTDTDYLLMVYNLNGKTLAAGKQAVMYIGDAEIATLRLADAAGNLVKVTMADGNTTGIDRMGKDVMYGKGIFNVKGQKVAGKTTDLEKLPKGVYIIGGEKVVK